MKGDKQKKILIFINITFISILVFGYLYTFPLFHWYTISFVDGIYYTTMDIFDRIRYNNINNEIVNDYLKETYGAISETFEVKNRNSYSKSITCPFMDNDFHVYIDNDEHKVKSDDFYGSLENDQKFQHLFSDYVKKQIGCDDENIRFDFLKNRKGARVFSEVMIDFSNINSIEKNYDEIFENISGLYLRQIYIKNCQEKKDNNIDIAKSIIKKYNSDIPKKISNLFLDEIVIYLFYYNFAYYSKDEISERINGYGTEKNITNYIISYKKGEDYFKLSSSYKDEDGGVSVIKHIKIKL